MSYVKKSTFTVIFRALLISLLIISCLKIAINSVSAQEHIEYQIKEGDNLWSIAHQFQLSVQEITEANYIDQDITIFPGQLIKIPKNQYNHSIPNGDTQTIIHTVQKGECLWDIAQNYRVSLDIISSSNDLKNPNSLYIGQEINIPIEKNDDTDQEGTTKISFEAGKSEILGISTNLNLEFRESAKEIDYSIKPGENLWTIAQHYQVSLNELSRINNLENAENLSIGQIIKIPLHGRSKDETIEREGSDEEKTQFDLVEHIVEYGENISIIAQKYHVPVETIYQLNQISKKDYIYPGQRIIVRASEQIISEGLTKQEEKDKKTKDPGEETQQPLYHTVKAGDTLWDIAKSYKVSMEGILAVNYLSEKDVLSVGQKLEIPAIGGEYRDSLKIQNYIYTVVKGDSLWGIAQKFDVKMHEIISINQLQNITRLSIDQKLEIPATGVASAQEPRTTTTVAQEEQPPTDIIHFVQKGETLWEISRKYQTSVQSITTANRISENSRIAVGQRLVIPNARSSPRSSHSFIWPLNGLITSQFGIRNLGGRRDYHTGIDIDGHTGASIRAAKSGRVSFSGYISGYGNTVIIDHTGGYSTVYAHNSSNLAKEGQNVTKGEIIARVGATGNATGAHLHFEIRENGKPVNPLIYLP